MSTHTPGPAGQSDPFPAVPKAEPEPAATTLPAWRVEADRRIEQYRKGDVTLSFVHGKPRAAAAGFQIRLEQIRPAFGVGIAFAGIPQSPWSEFANAHDFIVRHFNIGVSVDAMKFYSIERRMGRRGYWYGDRQVDWMRAYDWRVRGHCLLWSRDKYVQDWVKQLEPEQLRARVTRHVEQTVNHYKGRIDCWDVNNEMIDGRFYADRLGDDFRIRLFKRIHELDPNAKLFVNEYDILDNNERTDRYIELIKQLQVGGAPVGGIGIQEHACERIVPDLATARREQAMGLAEWKDRKPLTPDQMWAALDRMAVFGLPIHLTEISCWSPDKQRQGERLEMLYRIGFAHPAVEAILLWGIHEGRHHRGPEAGILDKQTWQPNAAGQRISDLLTRQWRTNLQTVADDQGRVKLRGFYGTYRVYAEDEQGQEYQGWFELRRGRTEDRVGLWPVR